MEYVESHKGSKALSLKLYLNSYTNKTFIRIGCASSISCCCWLMCSVLVVGVNTRITTIPTGMRHEDVRCEGLDIEHYFYKFFQQLFYNAEIYKCLDGKKVRVDV